MNLTDYTKPGGFLPRLDCSSVAEAVDRLAAGVLEGDQAPSAADLAHEVMRRETEGSSAIGGGLVIPHARFQGLPAVRLAVATLATPVDIPSEDGRPVDIVILLVGPREDPRLMLRVLARMARLVRQKSFLQGLRQAETPAELRSAFAKMSESSV